MAFQRQIIHWLSGNEDPITSGWWRINSPCSTAVVKGVTGGDLGQILVKEGALTGTIFLVQENYEGNDSHKNHGIEWLVMSV